MFSRVRRSMRPSPRDARPSGAPLPAEEVQAGLRRLESITARSQQDSKGRYEHPPEHFPAFIDHGFSGFRKWRRTVEPIPTLSPEELEQALPVSKPSAAALASPPQGAVMQVAWLGHASVLAQWDGWNVLADPIFSHRCAPVQFAGPARVRPSPVSADELPPIDAIVISHNHYDHLDLNTVVALASRAQPTPPVWCVPPSSLQPYVVEALNARRKAATVCNRSVTVCNRFVPLGTKAWMAEAGVSRPCQKQPPRGFDSANLTLSSGRPPASASLSQPRPASAGMFWLADQRVRSFHIGLECGRDGLGAAGHAALHAAQSSRGKAGRGSCRQS